MFIKDLKEIAKKNKEKFGESYVNIRLVKYGCVHCHDFSCVHCHSFTAVLQQFYSSFTCLKDELCISFRQLRWNENKDFKDLKCSFDYVLCADW